MRLFWIKHDSESLTLNVKITHIVLYYYLYGKTHEPFDPKIFYCYNILLVHARLWREHFLMFSRSFSIKLKLKKEKRNTISKLYSLVYVYSLFLAIYPIAIFILDNIKRAILNTIIHRVCRRLKCHAKLVGYFHFSCQLKTENFL